MNEKEKQIDEILKYIVNEISITSSMQEKAISSYQAVGSWIGNGINYDVRNYAARINEFRHYN